jgi:hypothetical protein
MMLCEMSFWRPAAEPHDVLAAEEFPLGSADPVLHHHGPVVLPPDPTGIQQPHDVLAAEEFPLPAPRTCPRPASPSPAAEAQRLEADMPGRARSERWWQRRPRSRSRLAAAAAGLVLLALVRRFGLRRRV